MSAFAEHELRLRERAAELSGRSDRLNAHGRNGVPQDFAEQASVRANDEVIEALSVRTRAELATVRAAIARIERGTYGRCLRCAGVIESARLAALPETELCTGCA